MKDTKTLLRPLKLSSTLVFLMTIIVYRRGVIAYDELSYKYIIEDLPTVLDFDRYLSALEKAVDFCIRHYKHCVDVNLQFGLFLIDVNLRQVMLLKRTNIPADTRFRLYKLFVKNNNLAEYFHFMLKKNQHIPEIHQNIKLALLFYNTTTWPKPLEKFNKDLLKQMKIHSPEQLEEMYGKWDIYYKNVNDFQKYKPSPTESDKCIALLAQTHPIHLDRRSQPKCPTSTYCKQLLREGSEFGYGLTHRLLFLVVARFSRRCVVFSQREDKYMTDQYCKKCFTEAEYIASNSFLLPDLMYEQIVLCGLLGHTQFIRNYWTKTLLQFQTSEGCFSEKTARDFDDNQMRKNENDKWIIEKNNINGQCNGHFTAVAAATLSNALRYIIETYY